MIRKEAITVAVSKIGNSPVVAANGYISRDLFQVCDKSSNFYMIGSMGLASSIGLGIAMRNPKKKVYVFDGDGNILMNLGSLTTVGFLKPRNLVHIIFDNSSHESTGGQPSNSNKVQIDSLAKASNYTTFKTDSKLGFEKILKKIEKISGPILILVKIKKSENVSKRIRMDTLDIKSRFMNAL